MKKPHNSPRALASLVAVSLTAATRLVLSGKCQTPKSIPQKQILPESGKQKILSPVFQILLFDHSNPNDTNNRLFLGQPHGWLQGSFSGLSVPLGIQDAILLFLAPVFPLGKHLGHKAHVVFEIMV